MYDGGGVRYKQWFGLFLSKLFHFRLRTRASGGGLAPHTWVRAGVPCALVSAIWHEPWWCGHVRDVIQAAKALKLIFLKLGC